MNAYLVTAKLTSDVMLHKEGLQYSEMLYLGVYNPT